MSYSGVVRRLLVSCPSDVPTGDLAIVRQTMNHWNGVYGEVFGTAVLPISWGEHAAAEFGQAPQNIINDQLVDKCDGCIAIFANRLGTPTTIAESGTAEEIQRLADSGKYVAILRCTRQIDASRLDYEQAARLNEYLGKIGQNALVLRYANDTELARHVDNILAQAVTRDKARAEVQLEAAGTTTSIRAAEIWPRVDTTERVKTDSRGRISTSRDWLLVLHNTGNGPARDVRFQTESPRDGEEWLIHRDTSGDEPDVDILAPGGEARFHILVSMGCASQVLCTVTWVDDRGPQENSATLRLT